jgi:tetratricopeptide (TPR) repeat protein/predicted Ser/Thr protein kinase
MMHDPRIQVLVEETLDSGCTPEEVCRDCPELLPAVREQWGRVQRLNQQLNAVFPSSSSGRTGPASTPAPTLPVIAGYEIQSILGKGGMGVVYRARHTRLQRLVALKMLLGKTFAGSTEQERFQREAEAVAALHSPHIIQIFDVGEHDGQPFFTMEYVDGGTLTQSLAGTPLPAGKATEHAILLAEAVAIAHASCIIHRDLKPANILLTSDGTLKISDFGLARRLSNDSDLTMSGAKLGTPSYMAPEQALGQSNAIGPAVDIYSLGAILYEMLTGRPPFKAETASETERLVISTEPVLPSRLNPKVPKDLETICLKCLRKDPTYRYSTAKALSDDLLRFHRGESILARPVGRPERVWRWMRRHPSTTAFVLTSLLLCIIAVSAAWREQEFRIRHRAEMSRWTDRLAYMSQLQQETRFAEARAVLQEAHTDDPELQAQINDARAQLILVEKLDTIRFSRDRLQADGNINYAASSKQYEAIFRDNGLGTFQDDPERIAQALIQSPVRKPLIAALDDWAACAEKKERDWVLRVARRLDPDPWRDRIRDIDGWANKENFSALADAADVTQQPVTLMVAFGTRWRRLGGDPTAFLERVQRQHPADFWVNFELCHLLEGKDAARAIGYARAALAVRPRSIWVNYKLAVCYGHLKQKSDAIFHYRQAIDSDPGFLSARINLGSIYANQAKYDLALDQWKTVLKDFPDYHAVRQAVVACLIRQNRPDEAQRYWLSLLQNRQTTFNDWDGYAELCLLIGNTTEYQQTCRLLLERFGSPTDPRDCERLGRTCLLSATPDLIQQGSKLINTALAADKKSYPEWVEPYFLFAHALAEYRHERWDRAASALQGAPSTILGPAPKLLLAMIRYRQGQVEEARELFKTTTSHDWNLTNALAREAWLYHILRREAAQIVK